MQALLLGRTDQEEVAREAMAQIEKLQRAGINITHLDTHKHTHLFPCIARPLLEVAERSGIRAIRNPFEPGWSLALGHGSRARRLAVRLMGRLRPRFEAALDLHHNRVLTTDGTVAISATGELNCTTLSEILRALPSSGTSSCAAIPATTTASWIAFAHGCALNATSSARPCSGNCPNSSATPTHPRWSTTEPLRRSKTQPHLRQM